MGIESIESPRVSSPDPLTSTVPFWRSRRVLFGAAVAVVVGGAWAVATGSVPIGLATSGVPQSWWGILAGAAGSGLIGAIVGSYVDAPIGAAATRCDTRWPALGLLGIYFAADVRSVIPILTGWSRPAVAVAALALLTWALVERIRAERRATRMGASASEVCMTCRPLFPNQ
jgi:hypothetical protein